MRPKIYIKCIKHILDVRRHQDVRNVDIQLHASLSLLIYYPPNLLLKFLHTNPLTANRWVLHKSSKLELLVLAWLAKEETARFSLQDLRLTTC